MERKLGPSFALLIISSIASLPGTLPLNAPKFEIYNDTFWKDGKPFQIIGGDVHYFRILPQYWEDRLLRAKALGLNTIQTYVPWNMHEPSPNELNFHGICNITAFLEFCKKAELLVMLRVGPYICAEWDFGGFPPWLLFLEPAVKLRSSDRVFLRLVRRWWKKLLPRIVSLLYDSGGPVIMVQIENEYGSFGGDKAYLKSLVALARSYLGQTVVLYTTDSGSREHLDRGTLRGDAVYSSVDFPTDGDPRPAFALQKEYNAPGKSPALSSEFYTGWLTHWGEKIAETGSDFTAASLERILSRNASAVLYMAHGGTNFGFYSGANTGADERDYKPDITSYDYDAPIKENGDIDNPKFRALQEVIMRYSDSSAGSPPVLPLPSDSYGVIELRKSACLLSLLDALSPPHESDNPLSMESADQMFGFMLYEAVYSSGGNNRSNLHIPKVHDRAQVFIGCPGSPPGHAAFMGSIERWSPQSLHLHNPNCSSFNTTLFILVENMGRVNYGEHLFDKKGILSVVYVDGCRVGGWGMRAIPLPNLNDGKEKGASGGAFIELVMQGRQQVDDCRVPSPAFYVGEMMAAVQEIRDTYFCFKGWTRGFAFLNGFNLGRFWPLRGPQCSLYVPAPIIRHGMNDLVIFELDMPHIGLVVRSLDKQDFLCGGDKLFAASD